jgi:hypothetical protein
VSSLVRAGARALWRHLFGCQGLLLDSYPQATNSTSFCSRRFVATVSSEKTLVCLSTKMAIMLGSISLQWVSHQNHRGNLAGVDFIYLLNPSNQCEKLEADWKYGAFAMIRVRLPSFLSVVFADRSCCCIGTHDNYCVSVLFQRGLEEEAL